MPRKRYRLTPAIEQAIVAYVRAGGFPHVAAEAAGVPAAVFEGWMKRADSPRAPANYRAFAESVRQAAAHARLSAEVEALKEKPLDWLRGGPGRQTADQSGWTGPARAPSAALAQTAMTPEVQRLITDLLAALAPHPEARAAVAAVLSGAASDSSPTQ